MLARHLLAKQLGRRVSKGEYERMTVGQLVSVDQPHFKAVRVKQDDGTVAVQHYHPRITIRDPDCAKSKRKKASRNG